MIRNKCKNCTSVLHGKFCSVCGQKAYTDSDKSIRNLISETFHFMTHFDGKIITTLKTIYKFPGKLSMDYSNGIRKKYYKPVSFHLLVIILYLLFPIATGMNMEMKYYKDIPFVGEYFGTQINKKLTTENINQELLSKKFNEKSKNTSKFLLLLLIPLSLPLLALLYYNRKRFIFDNVILLTEINIFFLLSFFILIPIIISPFSYFFDSGMHDNILLPLSIFLFGLYCTLVFKKTFEEKWWISSLKGGFFSLFFMFIIITIYKIIVFETTFIIMY